MDKLKKKISELIEETNKENKDKENKDIVKKLQEINDLFLTTYKLEINYNDKTITILPVETEIYFSSCKNRECKKSICEQCEDNNFYDGMIYENKRQKNHFGKLYFHRIRDEKNIGWGKNATDPIDLQSGGVDVCISNSDNYYLSILIRSAYINGLEEKNLVSGINKICKKIIEKMRKDNECVECLLKNIEENKVIVERERNKEKINIDNIFYQPRIAGEFYSSKDYSEEQNNFKFYLNSLNKGENNKILKDIIINSNQCFYNKFKKNKEIDGDKFTEIFINKNFNLMKKNSNK